MTRTRDLPSFRLVARCDTKPGGWRDRFDWATRRLRPAPQKPKPRSRGRRNGASGGRDDAEATIGADGEWRKCGAARANRRRRRVASRRVGRRAWVAVRPVGGVRGRACGAAWQCGARRMANRRVQRVTSRGRCSQPCFTRLGATNAPPIARHALRPPRLRAPRAARPPSFQPASPNLICHRLTISVSLPPPSRPAAASARAAPAAARSRTSRLGATISFVTHPTPPAHDDHTRVAGARDVIAAPAAVRGRPECRDPNVPTDGAPSDGARTPSRRRRRLP